MPHYDYCCESGHKFTREQRITDKPVAVCPYRGVDQDGVGVACCSPCKRLISTGTGFTLNGRGWGKDGYE